MNGKNGDRGPGREAAHSERHAGNNLRAYVELLRSDVRARKVGIITEVMQFTDAEDAKFWPVYRENETELAKVNDDRLALIKEYAVSYDKMTDAGSLRDRVTQIRPRKPTAKSASVEGSGTGVATGVATKPWSPLTSL